MTIVLWAFLFLRTKRRKCKFCIEDLRRFNNLSVISRLLIRRYPISEIQVARPGIEPQTPCYSSWALHVYDWMIICHEKLTCSRYLAIHLIASWQNMRCFTWIASLDRFLSDHTIDYPVADSQSLKLTPIYTLILLLKERTNNWVDFTRKVHIFILVCFKMSVYAPSNQKALGSAPAIHTYPIQVIFQIDQLPGQ